AAEGLAEPVPTDRAGRRGPGRRGMNLGVLVQGLVARETRTVLRDRQQVIGLVVFAVSMGFVAYMLESGPPLLVFRAHRRLIMLLVGAPLRSFASFMAEPLAVASFVGEKEERTLEVLLAAPIPDRTLYFAKCLGILLPMSAVGYLFLLAAVVYGFVAHPDYFASLPPGLFATTVLLCLPFPLLLTAMQV